MPYEITTANESGRALVGIFETIPATVSALAGLGVKVRPTKLNSALTYEKVWRTALDQRGVRTVVTVRVL